MRRQLRALGCGPRACARQVRGRTPKALLAHVPLRPRATWSQRRIARRAGKEQNILLAYQVACLCSRGNRLCTQVIRERPDLWRWRRRRRARQDVLHGVGGHKVTFGGLGFLAGACAARRHRRAAHAALPRGRPRCVRRGVPQPHVPQPQAYNVWCSSGHVETTTQEQESSNAKTAAHALAAPVKYSERTMWGA